MTPKEPARTHHLVPKRDGRLSDGSPSFVSTCSYCGRTEGDIRREDGVSEPTIEPCTAPDG